MSANNALLYVENEYRKTGTCTKYRFSQYVSRILQRRPDEALSRVYRVGRRVFEMGQAYVAARLRSLHGGCATKRENKAYDGTGTQITGTKTCTSDVSRHDTQTFSKDIESLRRRGFGEKWMEWWTRWTKFDVLLGIARVKYRMGESLDRIDRPTVNEPSTDPNRYRRYDRYETRFE